MSKTLFFFLTMIGVILLALFFVAAEPVLFLLSFCIFAGFAATYVFFTMRNDPRRAHRYIYAFFSPGLLRAFAIGYVSTMFWLALPVCHPGISLRGSMQQFFVNFSDRDTVLTALLGSLSVGLYVSRFARNKSFWTYNLTWKRLQADLVGTISGFGLLASIVFSLYLVILVINIIVARSHPGLALQTGRKDQVLCTAKQMAAAVFDLYSTRNPASVFFAYQGTADIHSCLQQSDFTKCIVPRYHELRPKQEQQQHPLAVVLLSGTEFLTGRRYTGVDTDYVAYLGFESSYQRWVRDLLAKHIGDQHAIAVVAVGHSLGGMTAESLGDEAERTHSELAVLKTITFGAPIISPEISASKQDQATPLVDLASKLVTGEQANRTIVRFRMSNDPIAMLPSLQSLYHFYLGIRSPYVTLTSSTSLKDAHNSYPNVTELNNYDAFGNRIDRGTAICLRRASDETFFK